MDVIRLWKRFRETPYFRVFYLTLIAVTTAFLMVSGNVCFAGFMAPVLILLIPHWLGERKIRVHVLNGLVVVAMAPLIYALIITPVWSGQPSPVLSSSEGGFALTDGHVVPFRTAGEADFNFTVVLTADDAVGANATVHLRVVTLKDFQVVEDSVRMAPDAAGSGDLADGLLANGERFYASVRLSPNIHNFDFHVQRPANDTWIAHTWPPGVGPFHAEQTTYLAFWLWNGYFFAFIFVATGFFIFVLLYWWIGKSRQIRRTAVAGRKRDEGEGEFTCTNCGADVEDADTLCPNCGAEFEAEAEGDAAKPGA